MPNHKRRHPCRDAVRDQVDHAVAKEVARKERLALFHKMPDRKGAWWFRLKQSTLTEGLGECENERRDENAGYAHEQENNAPWLQLAKEGHGNGRHVRRGRD